MRKQTFAALAALALAMPAIAGSMAVDTITPDTVLGTTPSEIETSLKGMGYEIREIEMEDGKIEIYFVGGGRKGEVYVSPETGKPTKIEME